MGAIEIKVDEYFDSYHGDDVIKGLLENGYILLLAPNRYSNGQYSIVVEIVDIEESFERRLVGGDNG